MARVLEVVAKAAPGGVTLRSLRALPDEGGWRVSLDALAAGSSPASRQAAERFVRALAEAPVFGEPLEPPTSRFMADGVEIAASYRVRK